MNKSEKPKRAVAVVSLLLFILFVLGSKGYSQEDPKVDNPEPAIKDSAKVAVAEKAEPKDTLKITSISFSSNIRSENVFGAIIRLEDVLYYDKRFHKNEKPVNTTIKFLFYDNNGDAVKAIGTNDYKGAGNQLSFTQKLSENSDLVFFPYYAIDLPTGKHELFFEIEAFVKDTSETQGLRKIVCAGDNKGSIHINKPEVERFKVIVRGVRVADHDFKGQDWDWGLSSPAPDIAFKILLSSTANSDYVYTSNHMRNSYSAAWIDFSVPVIISKGDKITIGIYDMDTIIDDLIGKKDFSFEELKAASDERKELEFGKVTFCLVDMKVVE